MNSFNIHCTTCRSRLRVNDPSAIGQILACPKCGSMVFVEEPKTSARAADVQDTVVDEFLYAESEGEIIERNRAGSPPDDSNSNDAALHDFERAPGEFELLDELSLQVSSDPPFAPIDAPSRTNSAAAIPQEVASDKPHRAVDSVRGTSPPSPPSSSPSSDAGRLPATSESEAAAPSRSADEVASQPLPTADWASAATIRWRNWTMIGAASLFGIALAVGVFALVISRNRDTQSLAGGIGENNSAEPTNPATPARSPDSASSDSPPGPTNDGDDNSSTLDRSSANEGEPDGASSTTPPNPADERTDVSVPPAVNPPAVDEPGRSKPTPGVSNPETNPKPNDNGSADAPNGFTPRVTPDVPNSANNDASPNADEPPDSPAAAGNNAPGKLPDQVTSAATRIDFGALIDPVQPNEIVATSSNDPESDDGAAPNETDVKPERAGDGGQHADTGDESTAALTSNPTTDRPMVPPVDVAARLADPLAAIQIADKPLADFIRVIENLSTIPITMDLDSIAMAGASTESLVSIDQQDITVGEALAAALNPLRLSYRVEGRHLLIVEAGAANEKVDSPIQATLDVSDLSADDVSLSSLAKITQTMVAPGIAGEAADSDAADIASSEPSDGDSDDSAARGDARSAFVVQPAGEGRLSASGDSHDIRRAELFLDRMRTARGIATRGRFGSERIAVGPPREQATDVLNAKITANFNRPTRLTRILDYLGAAAKARIVIDWRSLERIGWSRTTPTSVLAEGDALAATLDALLEPLDATWIVYDRRTIVVVSKLDAARRADAIFIPFSRPADPAAAASALEDIRAAADPALFSEGTTSALAYDPAGRHLILRAPQSNQSPVAASIAGRRD